MLNVVMLSIMTMVFGVYVLWIYRKYGVLSSISESYYRLPKNKKLLFTLFCWGFATPAIIVGDSVLMFLAGAGICFVGAAAAFKEEMDHKVHYIGAMSGIILSQLSIIFDMGLWPISVFAGLIALAIYLRYRKSEKGNAMTWWIEIVAFCSIILALTINMLYE